MVVGFTATYAISAYQSPLQLFMFVDDFQQEALRRLFFSGSLRPPIKLTATI
jgi:hypothetical protein